LLEAALAFEQLTLLVKESTAGREIARADIRALLDQLIDVVVQCGVERQEMKSQGGVLEGGSMDSGLPFPSMWSCDR
jgi:hypothetical protein